MKKILSLGFALLMFAVLVTAAVLYVWPYDPVLPPKVDDRASSPQGIQDVVNANNQFAFDLFHNLDGSNQENLFYSPYSISSAIAMTYEGAKGQTASEIKEVFHFPESSILRSNFAAIYNSINNNNGAYELRTGNALWAQYNYKFLNDYISNVETYYGGKVANLDFAGESEKSRQTINDFIEDQTNNRIKDLIPPGVLNSMTKLVLTNAIYFKGTWEWEFKKSDTHDQDFYITSSNIIKVPLMHLKNEKTTFNYASNNNLQILELPYKGDKVSMLILLPKEDLASIDSSLSAEKLNQYKSEMKQTHLTDIYLPKFEFDTKYMMSNTLKALGMPTSFSNNADFSGMDGTPTLQISEVIHQAFVKVDEEGTEAAAATAVIIKTMSAAPSQDNIFRADHPFIFIIQDKTSGNILFMGKVVDPTK